MTLKNVRPITYLYADMPENFTELCEEAKIVGIEEGENYFIDKLDLICADSNHEFYTALRETFGNHPNIFGIIFQPR